VSLIFYFLWPLLITQVVEISIALILGFRKKTEIAVITCINLITNPILNYLLLANYQLAYVKINLLIIIFLELIVVIVEWRMLVYSIQQKSIKLFILSLAMNFFSYISGILIFK
jgi:hypothetical protein